MSEEEQSEFELLLDNFIDGELDPSQRQELLNRAAKDPLLGAKLGATIELQQALSSLPMDKAPASLTDKLRKIPTGRSPWRFDWSLGPRTAFAALIVLALVGGGQLYQHQQKQSAQQAALAQAQQDLALVLSYLEKVNRSANTQIQMTVNHATAKPVARVTTEALQNQLQPNQEIEL
ncbi:MAG: hypothetical protein ABJN62_16280 [Halioglobus sp.]